MKKFLCAVIVLTLAIPANAVNIKEQGIFSAGGVVLSTDGTFTLFTDNSTRKARLTTQITQMFSTRFQKAAANCRWCSFMVTDNREWVG